MSVGVGSGRGVLRRLAVAAVAAAAAITVVPAGGTALAQCDIETDRGTFDLRDAGSSSDAIVLRADDAVHLERPADGFLAVLVWYGPLPVPLPSFGDEGGSADLVLGDYAWLAVGMYRIQLTGPGAGECTGTFWVRVEGRSALTTVAGVASIGVLLGGVAIVASAVRRGRRTRCSIGRGSVGGLLSGVGLAALAQQILFLPMLVPVIVAAAAVPAVVGALIARVACVRAVVSLTLTPLLAAPLMVRPGEEFAARVGVGIAGPPAGRRRRREATHEVVAQVVCAGAEVVAGQPSRRQLVARAGGASAEHVVRMRATREVGESHLTVLYSSAGQTVGMARRPLWVGGEDEPLPPPHSGETAGLPFTVPAAQPPVDLELRATFAGPRRLNVLQWTMVTPHGGRVPVPDRPAAMDLGAEPEQFAADLLADVTASDGRAGLDELLLGAGRQLARCFDRAVLDVVRRVLDLVPHARVLLLSEESSVPWELTVIEPAPQGEPPFLATRAVIGRWFLDPGAVHLPPPIGIPVGERTVIATDVLPAAQVEARRLASEFAFHPAMPTVAQTLTSLERSALVHLACHGSWHPGSGHGTLELNDGRVVPRQVAGLRLARRPFVFLNACQVAGGGDELGSATGFPAELVFAGGSGCVTPLWSVGDDEACELAIEFYRAVLAGRPPAEVIREQRWRAMTDTESSATPFAYQYIGHPDLHLAPSKS